MKGHCQGTLDRSAIEEISGIGKTRFFALLRQYRHVQEEFSLTSYQRETQTRLSASVEKQIENELPLERELLDDSIPPITTYTYPAIGDRLAKRGAIVCSPTIIERAKGLAVTRLIKERRA